MGGSGSSSGKGGGGAGGASAMRTRAEIENEVNSIKYRTSRGVSRAEYDDGNTYVESSIRKTSDGYRADVYADSGQTHYYKTLSTQAKAKSWAKGTISDIAYEDERKTYEMTKIRGSSSSRKSSSKGIVRARTNNVSSTSQAQRNPSSAPVGTKLSMGGWTYTKTKNNTWVTYGPTRKRAQNRKDADIKRVFK